MKILGSLGLSVFIGIASLALPSTAWAQSADVSKPGVYANTDAGVVTLSAFYSGVMTSLPVGFQTHTVAVPKAKTLNSFIVNVPGVDASRIALYYLNGLQEVWSGGQTPLQADVKTEDGRLVVSSSEWSGRAPGFAILEIKAGPDGIRRFYAVNMGKGDFEPGKTE